MILRGRLPLQRKGRSKEVNKDTHLLLRCFIPRGQACNRALLGAACRTLHLAFKGMDADGVYDQLMICLVKAIKRYDPQYSNKGKATVEVLEGGLKLGKSSQLPRFPPNSARTPPAICACWSNAGI